MVNFILLFHLVSTGSGSPHIDCFLDNQECAITPDNLIHTYMGIPTIEECLQLCDDEVTCIAFTHYNSDSLPFHDGCLLFSSCRERRPWQDCTTGSSQTECLCGIPYSGDVNLDNFVDLVSATDEQSCKKECITNSECHLYTFYDNEDIFQPKSCILLTSAGLRKAVVPCDHCSTGPSQCNVNQTCQAAVITNGSGTQYFPYMAEASVSLTLTAAEKDCFVEFGSIAIGGGGEYMRGTYGGGGSGYIEAKRFRLIVNNPKGCHRN